MERRGFIKSLFGGLFGLLGSKIFAEDKPANPEIDFTQGFVAEHKARELDAQIFDDLVNKNGIKEPEEVVMLEAIIGVEPEIEMDYISWNINERKSNGA